MTETFLPETQSFAKNNRSTEWVKQRDIEALTFIKPNVVAFGRGSTITFVNLDDGTERYYHCKGVCNSSNIRSANGISCLAAHRSHPIFAFAELSLTARLVLITYPDFRHVTTLDSSKTGEYISLELSETEHLIALKSLPQYWIEVWNWRTDRLLAVQQSDIISNDKYIRCSYSLPLTMFQLSRSQSKMDFWEIHFSLEAANLIRRSVKMPIGNNEHNFDATIGIDGLLYFVDGVGNVWSLSPTSGKDSRIIPSDNDEQKTTNTSIKYVNGGLVIITGKTLRMFKKAMSKWSECWSITHTCNIKSITCNEDQLIILSANGEIMTMRDSEKTIPNFSSVISLKRLFKFIALVNPICEYFVATTEANEIIIYNVENGKEESSLELPGIKCMTSHETMPVIAVGTREGVVFIVCAVDPKAAIVLHRLYLCRDKIDNIQFISGSHHIVAISGNDFYLLEGEFGKSMQVKSRISIELHPLDFSIIAQSDQSRSLVILTASAENGEYFSDLLEEIAIDKSSEKRIDGVLPHSYTRIMSNSEIARYSFFGARYNSKMIDVIQIERGNRELSFVIMKSIETEHHLKYLNLTMDKYFLISCSFDGLIFVWNLNDLEFERKYQAHNRYTYGVKTAICTPTGEFVISLGQSGNLVCNRFEGSKHLSRKRLSLREAIGYDLTQNGEILYGDDQGKPWIDIQAERELEIIRREYAKEKDDILQELHAIKEKLKICIDANEADPPEEQLPINSFNLDLYGAQSLIEIARNQRELEHQALKNQCEEQNALIEWIKKNTWELMEVKSTKLRGIFSKLCVENYALQFADRDFEDNIRRIQFRRSREQMASSSDIFHPWLPRSVDQLEQQLALKPSIVRTDDIVLGSNISFASRVRSHFTFRNQKSVSMELPDPSINYALSGTSTHLYVRQLEFRYGQMEVVTYNQMYAEHQMGLYDLLQLRKHFNKKFDALMNDKKVEMNLVKERNKRLLYIQTELNDLKRLDGYSNHEEYDHNDPEFAADEMPETIVQVDDSEVSVMPYVSASQQNILNCLADEAEKRRQDMLKDDFRERALMDMMDGVLEVRWEDEIKKNPSKPKCLLANVDPNDYTDQDMEEVQFYEKRMQHVKEERKKYYDMLIEEKTSVHQLLESQILSFNRHVGELLLSKIRIEFAMCSEDMKMLLYSKFNFERDQFREHEDKLLKQKRGIKNDIDELMKTLAMLEGNFYTCKTKYDELVLKDRMLDKQFKSSFSEYAAQAVVDQAYRIFRRRPRLQPRAWQTAAVLSDMAKRVSVADSSMTGPPLPEECFQYLNTIDHIERFSNAPNLMDQNLWQILCRMRRNKIEVELKLRSCGEQLEEAEAAINTYSREISYQKVKLSQCDRKLEDLKEQKAKHLINRNIQIYTKRGNVEIPLNGRMSDFENAILLHKVNLNETNALIQEAGKKKLKVMQNAAVFRRHVQCQEWKHKELKMKIDDLKNSIKFIDKCKVTKEVQIWLKRKQLGRTEDLSDSAIERDISVRIASYERVNNDLTKKLNRLNALIENEMRQNDILDRKIQNLNLNIQEQSMTKDLLFGEKEQERRNGRMAIILERARLVRKVQQQHSRILEHSTMLELQRLRTYPTLNLSKTPEKHIWS